MLLFNVKTGTLPIFVEKLVCSGLVVFLTPSFYIFHMTLVRPSLVEMYNIGPVKHCFHVCFSTFLFINVCGNMIMALLTDTSSKFTKTAMLDEKKSRFCEYCNKNQPLKSFHCKVCNVCILKRDHHCIFFSRCIGLYNQRYYMMYLLHINISLFYSAYYDYYFISSMFDTYGFLLAICRALNPAMVVLTAEPTGARDLYVLFFVINGIFIFWATGVFYYHIKNIMGGITAYEMKNVKNVDTTRWKKNMLNTFGVRWYWALVWPLADSPLPLCSDCS